MRGERGVGREEPPDAAASPAERAPPGRADGEAAAAPRRRTWLRRGLLVLGGVLAVPAAAATWLALDPTLLRPTAEYLVTAATGRPTAIGGLDFQVAEGRILIEARKVRVGRTTTERVSVSLAGMRAQANGDGLRFPNGSSIGHFRASIDLSLTGLPRVTTVDATDAVLVAVRRGRSDPDGPPPLARLLIVPRILLRLGLERLVLHSGEIEYRGRSSVRSAGMTAEVRSTDRGLRFHGALSVGAGAPPLPFDGAVRDPMSDDWRIDVRLAGEDVPMEGVRRLAGVLEPGDTVRAALGRIANEARFVLAVRLAQARIEWADLDFTFRAPGRGGGGGGPDEGGGPGDAGGPEDGGATAIDLEGVRFLARTTPHPGGWTVTGEVDWSRLSDDGGDAERSPFALRWSTGAPGSLRWSARRVAIPLLARAAGNALPPAHPLPAALDRLRPEGTIDELAAFGDPGAGDEPSFWLSAAVSGFGASVGGWRISEAAAKVEFADGGWRVRFVDDRLVAAMPSFRSAPWELTLRGEVGVTAGERAWTARTEGLRLAAAGVAGRIAGRLEAPFAGREGAPLLDAELRLDETALTDVGAMLPDLRAPGFARWYRRTVRSGRITGSRVRVRGDPRRIPFPKGEGEFRATGTVRGVRFAYAEGWPAVRIEEARMRAEGPELEFSGGRGSIFDTAIEDGAARLRDVTDRTGRVQVSFAASGPARDLLAFVRASPLRTEDGGPAPDLLMDGPAAATARLGVPYGPGAADRALDVAGTISLGGVAIRLADRRAVLEGVVGDLAFDAETLTGGPLRGRLRGAGIETHVEFDRSAGLALRFSGEGDGDWFGLALDDLVDLGPEETGPWLEPVRGRASWDAEYRSRGGIVFRSDLRSASVELPPPFEKRAGTARRLEVVLAPGEAEWRIGASYGPDVKGEFEIADLGEEWALTRGGLALGGARPALPSESHVEVTGGLDELDLDQWLALGAAPSSGPTGGWLSRIGRISLETAGARVAGRRVALERFELVPASDGAEFHVVLAGEGLAGEVVFPADPASGQARARLDRVHLDPPPAAGEEDGERPGDEPDGAERPDRWPSFDVRIGSLRFEQIDLGAVRVVGVRTDDGIEFEKIAVDSPGMRVRGKGSWRSGEDGAPVSRFEAKLNSENLSRLLASADLDEEAVTGGMVEIRFALAWPGSPLDPSLAKAEGAIEMDAEDGRLPRIRTGPIGRLLGLVSLDALPRVLALDLSHVVGKGFAYDRLTARTRIEDGSARIREFDIKGPNARIEASGSIDLVARRYDQEITVIPLLTRSGALFPVWATVWPYLAANFLLEKVVGAPILDRVFSLRYRLHGPLDDPVVERIRVRRKTGRQ